MTTKHTPTCLPDNSVGEYSEQKANAAFIVRAVNAQADLVEALDNLLVFFSEYEKDYGEIVNPLMTARAVLAKAKGE